MSDSENFNPRVVIALDYADAGTALVLVDQLSNRDCRLKVGLELYTAAGNDFVSVLVGRGFDVFLDLKFHDIPNTVARACRVAAGLGVWMINVHALGGPRMVVAAREAIDDCTHRPLLIGVTVLTSHDNDELNQIGIEGGSAAAVLRLAGLARQAGLDGVVCSPQEASQLKNEFGAGFKLVTPGVRPEGSDTNDQKRTMTPKQAIAEGADYLVIGRPITQAVDPIQALADINQSLSGMALT